MKNSIQDGLTIRYNPPVDIEGGNLIVFDAMVGVAYTDIAQGDVGALATEGVFELEKDTSVFAQGQAVYAKKDGTVTATATGNMLAGKCWQSATKDDGIVAVKINV